MKPEDWTPGTVHAIATGSEDRNRIVIKAVNYESKENILITRLQGSNIPEEAEVTVYKLTAGLKEAPSMENPTKIEPVQSSIPYKQDMTIELEPYTVAVVEISAN